MFRTIAAIGSIAIGLVAVAPLTHADNLLLDGIDVARPSAHLRPARGTSMAAVEARFGSPAQQQAAIGDPPITRWEYPGFVVYFENDLVIHAVTTP
ncbi:MAG TPA: hypothetical protein VIV14_02485 [Gammaproteobacteria bacterium]